MIYRLRLPKRKKGLKWCIEFHMHPVNYCNPLIFNYKFFFFLIISLLPPHVLLSRECTQIPPPKKKKKKALELRDTHKQR